MRQALVKHISTIITITIDHNLHNLLFINMYYIPLYSDGEGFVLRIPRLFVRPTDWSNNCIARLLLRSIMISCIL